ncbi:MAG: ribulose-phosphate 3-epimerase, partial [Candidatus Gastranaerophilaceae bacterium]
VNPGFAGQKMVENCMKKADKVGRIIKRFKREDIIFEVDGNISFENAKKLKTFGANLFVGGTSSLFSSKNLKANILKLKQNIQE